MIGKHFLLNISAIAIATAFLPGLVRADVVLDSQAGLTACLFDANGQNCGPKGVGFTASGGSGGSSQYGGITTANNVDPSNNPTPGKSVVVTRDTAWAPNNPVNPGDSSDTSAVWIGAVKSGEGDPDFVASNFKGLPVYQITDTFSLVNAVGLLALDVWADDTTAVLLDGQQIVKLPAPDATNPNSTCQSKPISCTLGNNGEATDVDVLGAGLHTLTFDVWQTGGDVTTSGNPTGLLFTGYVTDQPGIPTGNVPTPEAGVLSMLISMLGGIAAFALFAKKKLA